MIKRAKPRGQQPCPICAKPKSGQRVQIWVRADERIGRECRPIASRSVTVCGNCADALYDAVVERLP